MNLIVPVVVLKAETKAKGVAAERAVMMNEITILLSGRGIFFTIKLKCLKELYPLHAQ